MAKKNAMSLSPDDFTEGGGLIDDVDATIKEARFVMWDYNGKRDVETPALKLELTLEDDDTAEQYYSMGSEKDWMPSDDGTQLLAIGQASGIRKTSNGGIFLISLVDAGFPAEDLGDDISVLDNLQAHFVQVPAPKRKGLKVEESKYEKTILVVSEIIAMPGEKKKPKGAPKGKAAGKKPAGKGKAKAEGSGDDEVQVNATAAILALLEDEPAIAKKDLPAMLLKSYKGDDRNAIIKMAFEEDFLSDGPWTYEDGTLVAS